MHKIINNKFMYTSPLLKFLIRCEIDFFIIKRFLIKCITFMNNTLTKCITYFNILVIKTINVQQKKELHKSLRCAKSLKGVPMKLTIILFIFK
jgi:hypothetical protein